MTNPLMTKYADLLVRYCLDIQPGDTLLIHSTTLAEPLVREVYRLALRAGGMVDVQLRFQDQNKIFLEEAKEDQLAHISPLYQKAMYEYKAYLRIMAPFNLREDQEVNGESARTQREHYKDIQKTYFSRTATRDLKRNLCLYPTDALAQNAGMSSEEYAHFVFKACKILDEDPVASWLNVRAEQQKIVDFLNQCSEIHYLGEKVDIRFSTKGRTWINSDGQTNMPSGEVYTSPVEDSVNGTIHFSYPGIYMGHEVEDVTLWVEDGTIQKWEASRGKKFLDYIFSLEGARRFGEAAIGTNRDIDRLTKNILFDEKIGGTIHMAIGQSYLQAGGKNTSSVHWDMITEMRNGGIIYADGEKVYENGQFIIFD
jgi:aminopeptidase